MPKTRKQVTTIYTSLTAEDSHQFDAIVRMKGLTRTEVAREALRYYIAHQEELEEEQRDSKLERRLKKIEDRLAGIMARVGIDVGVIYTLMWRNMPPDRREDQLKSAYTQAVDRLKKKAPGLDTVARDLMQQ